MSFWDIVALLVVLAAVVVLDADSALSLFELSRQSLLLTAAWHDGLCRDGRRFTGGYPINDC